MSRRWTWGALWGALIGIAVGIVAALPTGHGDRNVLMAGILGGLAVGFVLGGLVGVYWPRRRIP